MTKNNKIVESVTEVESRINPEEETRMKILDVYAECWNSKSVTPDFEEYLSEDFHYSSFWVFSELDKKGYLEYLSGKFGAIEKSHSNVKARVVSHMLLVTQDRKNGVIYCKFKEGKLIRADMMPASFYGFPDIEPDAVVNERKDSEGIDLNWLLNEFNEDTEKFPDSPEPQRGMLTMPYSLSLTERENAAEALGNAIIYGMFDDFAKKLDDNVETVISDEITLSGKEAAIEYWKDWKEKYVDTKKAEYFEVIKTKYYNDMCLKTLQKLVLFNIEDGKVTQITVIPEGSVK